LIERDTSTKKFSVPFAHIIDRPRFPWRGLMLDVSRHWMPVSVIERTLNAMELSKLNVLHLHLSDDQGFRVESLQHRLLHDRKDFFTQKDIRYLVEYARQRRIRIMPEFDIPGHTTR
jgi:hexosaminidase